MNIAYKKTLCNFVEKKPCLTTFLPSVKTLTKNISKVFSFSTGFLFVKKKKCYENNSRNTGL